ncbi:hypothetical protein GCM10027404_07360 [Arthrobacter tumbae]|uniref:hypothetical protein n=1 Tax=Arthrobacter tumbae TaxID=163874 RepID=UPI0019565AA8|nr:hypothetical protein [Arthrobacter tumbae]MBM7783306.1 hypothetical protein [Arthrobacter tumbae]
MSADEGLPARGAVFWPVGTGDSTTVVVDETLVLQVDLHDMAKADDEANPEVAVVDKLVEALPVVEGKPYLAVFALTHADKDHCLGFADLLSKVRIGELWSTPRLWHEYYDPDTEDPCEDAVAFREESERRIEATEAALTAGEEPTSGDRVLVIGYDDEHGKHPYDELPEQYKSGPGKSVTVLDGHECEGRFEAFFHAPFREDSAAPRNETSLAMQVTLTDDSGIDGKVLMFGDLAHDTIMKIFDYSEYHNREQYLEWDLLLAPHHCSKKVMYKPDDEGKDVLQMDVLNAFERNARDGAVIVSSSALFPAKDVAGANPPHRKAADRYSEIADEVICTMSWVDETAPSAVVFGVDVTGAGVVQDTVVELAASESTKSAALTGAGTRLAAVTAAAVNVAKSLPAGGVEAASGPERVQQAVSTDRGGDKAPDAPVGFGR